jgi:hypothetical protein
MSSITNYFEKHLPSARERSSANIASIIVIFLGVTAILIFLSPR